MGNLDDANSIDGVVILSQGGTKVGGEVAGILDQPKMHDSMVVQERVWRLEDMAEKLDSLTDQLLGIIRGKSEQLESLEGKKYLLSLIKTIGEILTELTTYHPKQFFKIIMDLQEMLENIQKKDWESCKNNARQIHAFVEGFTTVLSIISDQDVTVVDVP